MEDIILNVKGMMCEGCENRIKNALKTIDGVKKVEADHVSGIVKISTKNIIDQGLLKQKIEDIGYEIIK